jgi:hypothetical protein
VRNQNKVLLYVTEFRRMMGGFGMRYAVQLSKEGIEKKYSMH